MTSKITKKTLGNLEIAEISCGNSKAEVSTFGAQVISWSIAGKDIFYSNPCLITDKSKPLRAGAPICFPWFNKGLSWELGRELSPSHGPARSNVWQQLQDSLTDSGAKTGFVFDTSSYLQLPLRISVQYEFSSDALGIEFTVKNPCPHVNQFELALHSYFATSKPAEARISGLREFKGTPFTPPLPINRIFENEDTSLNAEFSEFRLEIENKGFSKSVIWHPGFEHQLADLPKDQSPLPFLCLESLTEKIEMAGEAEWRGSVYYRVS